MSESNIETYNIPVSVHLRYDNPEFPDHTWEEISAAFDKYGRHDVPEEYLWENDNVYFIYAKKDEQTRGLDPKKVNELTDAVDKRFVSKIKPSDIDKLLVDAPDGVIGIKSIKTVKEKGYCYIKVTVEFGTDEEPDAYNINSWLSQGLTQCLHDMTGGKELDLKVSGREKISHELDGEEELYGVTVEDVDFFIERIGYY